MVSAKDYVFKDAGLRELALTHRSLGNETGDRRSNERLEFLGDAVIELIVSHALFERYSELPEGELSRLRAAIVNESALAIKARSLALGASLRLSQGEHVTGGREKDSLLADVYEALVGAIYLDAGFAVAEAVVKEEFAADVAAVASRGKDAKTELQEWAQKQLHLLPRYVVAGETGPQHARAFHCEVVIGERVAGRGSGKSKKLAEQAAAQVALEMLRDEAQEKT